MRKCVWRGILLCIIIIPHHRLSNDKTCGLKCVSVHDFFLMCCCFLCVCGCYSQTFCVTHWWWSIYIGRFLLWIFISASCTMHFFFLMGVVCLCEHIFFFIFLKGFVHREMKERKACNEVAQPTQHCAVVSTPSHTLLFAYCPAAMYWRLWLSFTATVNWIVREAARLRCYRLFVLNFCFAFQFL